MIIKISIEIQLNFVIYALMVINKYFPSFKHQLLSIVLIFKFFIII
jgi:hypothetical protein